MRLGSLAGIGSRLVTADANGDLSAATTTGTANGLFWGLAGNAGTAPATQFMGTADAQDLVLRTNNTERLRLKSSNGALWTAMPNNNVALGANTGATLTSRGSNNTLLGHNTRGCPYNCRQHYDSGGRCQAPEYNQRQHLRGGGCGGGQHARRRQYVCGTEWWKL